MIALRLIATSCVIFLHLPLANLYDWHLKWSLLFYGYMLTPIGLHLVSSLNYLYSFPLFLFWRMPMSVQISWKLNLLLDVEHFLQDFLQVPPRELWLWQQESLHQFMQWRMTTVANLSVQNPSETSEHKWPGTANTAPFQQWYFTSFNCLT